MKRLLVTGSSGMLGSNIVFNLGEKFEVFGADKNASNGELKKEFNIDLSNGEEVRRMIHLVNPYFVIHCAAVTDVELCEDDYDLAYNSNAVATKNLCTILSRAARIIYISTDSVFDGKKGGYTETDLTCPLNNYAKSKLQGEQFIEQFFRNYVIIRTNIFGWSRLKGQSFAEWIFNSLKQKKTINMFADVIFSPVTANTLSLLLGRLLNIDFIGRLNMGSIDSISKYDFGISLAKLFRLDETLIKPVSIDTFAFKAKRPKDTSLNVSKANEIFGSMSTVMEELIKFNQEKVDNETIYSNRKT